MTAAITLRDAYEIKELFCSWILQREARHATWQGEREGGGAGGGACGKECPACMLPQGARELGEGEVSWTSAFTGVRMQYTSERLEGISLVPLKVTRSQGSARRRSCGREQPYHTLHWPPEPGCQQPICGVAEA